MSVEIEAKFLVPDGAAFDRLRLLERLGRYSLVGTRLQDVRDEYLDTPDLILLAAGWACRMRAHGGRVLVTLKSVRTPPGDLHRREELEVSLAARSASTRAAPSTWPVSPARSMVRQLVGSRGLQVLFRLRQKRLLRDVMDEDRPVALASLDQVRVTPGGSHAGRPPQWRELELELAPGGSEAELADLSRWVRSSLGLSPSPASKFERALHVLKGRA